MNQRPVGSGVTVAQLRSNIVRIAIQELRRWNPGGRRRVETEPAMGPILRDYWLTGAGVSFSLSQLADPVFQGRTPWSGAFICWVMRQAGAGSSFTYNPLHTIYVAAAKRNRLTNAANPFYAYRPHEVVPEPGDMICFPRGNSGVTYDNVSNQFSHTDIVVAKRPGQLTLVGGNVWNSVATKTLQIGPDGRVLDPSVYAIIKLVGGSAVGPMPSPSVGSAPRGSETGSVEARSLYLPISIGAMNNNGTAAPAMTGVYVPRAFRPRQPWTVLLYLHGHKGNNYQRSIRDIWNPQQGRKAMLREALERSGRNIVMIAPTLGNRSQAGWLTQAGGLDRFLQVVLPQISSRLRLPQSPSLNQIVLACHSGGGSPMLSLAHGSSASTRHIRECWGFDSMYNQGSDRSWGAWADRNPGSRLFVYYLAGTQTAALSESLSRLRKRNVQVIRSGAGAHDFVPVHHLPERLAALG